jgi:hypothetical protein
LRFFAFLCGFVLRKAIRTNPDDFHFRPDSSNAVSGTYNNSRADRPDVTTDGMHSCPFVVASTLPWEF